MSNRKNPARSQGTAHRTVGDEGGLIVLPDRAEVKVLNPVGSLIYSMLDGTKSIEQIVKAVVDEFEVAETEARTDVEGFLEQLRAEGLLATVNADGEGV